MISNQNLSMSYHQHRDMQAILSSPPTTGSSFHIPTSIAIATPSSNGSSIANTTAGMFCRNMMPSIPQLSAGAASISSCSSHSSWGNNSSGHRHNEHSLIAPPPFGIDDDDEDYSDYYDGDEGEDDVLMKRSITEIEPTPIGPLNSVKIFDEIPMEEKVFSIPFHPIADNDMPLEHNYQAKPAETIFPSSFWQQQELQYQHVPVEQNPLLLLQSPQKKRKVISSNSLNDNLYFQQVQPGNMLPFQVNSVCGFSDPSNNLQFGCNSPQMVAPRRVSCTSTGGCFVSPPSVHKQPAVVVLKKHDKWYDKYLELCDFYKKHGHCLVPVKMPGTGEDLQILSQWVKRQRHQHKLKRMGRHSTLTEERIAALQQLEFVWDSHEAIWNERFCELLEFRARNGHCNVPTKYPENPQLSIWVKCQRRQYKLYLTGKKANINKARIAKLDNVGLDWNPRNLSFDDLSSVC